MNPLNRTFDAMINSLRQHVLPAIDDDFARGQAFGVIYMLEQLRLQVDWSVSALLAQVCRQRDAAEQILALCEGTDAPAPPTALREPIAAATAGHDLLALRDAGDEWLCRLLEWLAGRPRRLASERIAALEASALACAREVNAVEARQTPKPMFAQIASGRDPSDAREPDNHPPNTEKPC